ncbi:VOC family protein [Pseudogracilibacillus sp. SO30301A]|uniref:VOC family protein n=1 Tax=Pseudogracilibacillus sp. SO30301A TaxID=3098291 RepID=UPI00300E4D12
MKVNSFYPVIMSNDVKKTSKFYKKHFGFLVLFEANWYISLKKEETGHELAIIDATHETIPSSYRKAAQGLILNFEVENADHIYQQFIKEAQLLIHLDIRDEEFG